MTEETKNMTNFELFIKGLQFSLNEGLEYGKTKNIDWEKDGTIQILPKQAKQIVKMYELLEMMISSIPKEANSDWQKEFEKFKSE